MDESYDVIVLGTGLKECILSGLMSSIEKKKVLHLDRNGYYGGESASLNLDQLYEKGYEPYKGKRSEERPDLGKSKEYCVDLCPKFLMAGGDLVKILVKTDLTAYLEFRSVFGSYVQKGKNIKKVPNSAKDAMSSDLMGMIQKRHYRNFIQYCMAYEPSDPKTHNKMDLTKDTCAALYKKYKLDANTQAFTGHAVALYLNDDYLEYPAIELVERAKLYVSSVMRYGQSPYIYPKWGLGGLPEGFSRKAAVHGGVYMLNIDDKKDFIEEIKFDKDGKVSGVTVGGATAPCKQLIADPSYFKDTDKVEQTGQIARCICVLKALPKDLTGDSAQVIIPAKQISGRKSDVYICVVSSAHAVCSTGKFLAVISAKVENKDDPRKDLEQAYGWFEDNVLESFFWVTDTYQAKNNPEEDNCFISSSYDATTHFQTSTEEVLALFAAISGHELELSQEEKEDEKEDKKEDD